MTYESVEPQGELEENNERTQRLVGPARDKGGVGRSVRKCRLMRSKGNERYSELDLPQLVQPLELSLALALGRSERIRTSQRWYGSWDHRERPRSVPG